MRNYDTHIFICALLIKFIFMMSLFVLTMQMSLEPDTEQWAHGLIITVGLLCLFAWGRYYLTSTATGQSRAPSQSHYFQHGRPTEMPYQMPGYSRPPFLMPGYVDMNMYEFSPSQHQAIAGRTSSTDGYVDNAELSRSIHNRRPQVFPVKERWAHNDPAHPKHAIGVQYHRLEEEYPTIPLHNVIAALNVRWERGQVHPINLLKVITSDTSKYIGELAGSTNHDLRAIGNWMRGLSSPSEQRDVMGKLRFTAMKSYVLSVRRDAKEQRRKKFNMFARHPPAKRGGGTHAAATVPSDQHDDDGAADGPISDESGLDSLTQVSMQLKQKASAPSPTQPNTPQSSGTASQHSRVYSLDPAANTNTRAESENVISDDHITNTKTETEILISDEEF